MNQQASIEELKECPFCGSAATSAGHDDVRCTNDQCGMAFESVSLYTWNRLTEPSPAEVSDSKLLGELLAHIHRDGGHHQAEFGTVQAVADALEIVGRYKFDTEPAEVSSEEREIFSIECMNADELRGYEYGTRVAFFEMNQLIDGKTCRTGVSQQPWQDIKEKVWTMQDKALSQQSPATAEGELIAALRFQVESGESYEVKRRHAIAAIERALNQRLAGKEGEAVAYIYEHGDFAHYSGGIVYGRRFVQFERMTGFQTGYFGTCKDLKETPLYTHPVSDDQQAKDAALYKELLYCVGNKYPGESRHDTAKRYLLDREKFGVGEPALSTTKQEEV